MKVDVRLVDYEYGFDDKELDIEDKETVQGSIGAAEMLSTSTVKGPSNSSIVSNKKACKCSVTSHIRTSYSPLNKRYKGGNICWHLCCLFYFYLGNHSIAICFIDFVFFCYSNLHSDLVLCKDRWWEIIF